MNKENFEYQYITDIGRENLTGKVINALDLVSMIDGLVKQGNFKEDGSEVMASVIIDLIFSHTIDLKRNLNLYIDNMLE